MAGPAPKKVNKIDMMEKLIVGIEEGYRKHPLKIQSYEHK